MAVAVFCPDLSGADASAQGRPSSRGRVIPSDNVTLGLENGTRLSSECSNGD